jgi:hypothetical protein
MNPPKSRENSITRYYIAEEKITGRDQLFHDKLGAPAF